MKNFGFFVNSLSKFGPYFLASKIGSILLWMYLLHLFEYEDIALISISNLIVGFVGGISTLGMHSTTERFYFEWSKANSKVFSLWVGSLFSSLFITIVVFFILLYFGKNIFKSMLYYDFILITSISLFFYSFFYMINVYLRVTGKISILGKIILISFVLNVISTLYFINKLDNNCTAFILGTMVGNSFYLITSIYFFLFNNERQFVEIKNEIRYSFKVLPTITLNLFVANVDKYLFEKILPQESFGKYSLIRTFTSYFGFINQITKSLWVPEYYKAFIKNNYELMDQLSKKYLLISFPLLILYNLLIYTFFNFYDNGKYYVLFDSYLFMTIPILFQILQISFTRGPDILKKPLYELVSPILSFLLLIFIVNYTSFVKTVFDCIFVFCIFYALRFHISFCISNFLLKKKNLYYLPLLSFSLYFMLIFIFIKN